MRITCNDDVYESKKLAHNTCVLAQFVSQTMENSTDAVHITPTLSNIYNGQNSRSRPRYLDLEDAES